jgi:hypothetical protein
MIITGANPTCTQLLHFSDSYFLIKLRALARASHIAACMHIPWFLPFGAHRWLTLGGLRENFSTFSHIVKESLERVSGRQICILLVEFFPLDNYAPAAICSLLSVGSNFRDVGENIDSAIFSSSENERQTAGNRHNRPSAAF